MGTFVFDHPILTYCILAFAAAGIYREYQRVIRPLFIPKAELDHIVDAMIADFGSEAEFIASIYEDREIRRLNAFEAGKWRRVGHRLRLRNERLQSFSQNRS